jgi:hypothetical protein
VRRIALLAVILAGAACGSSQGNGSAGDSCKTNQDCAMGLSCYSDPFPDGYCAADCSSAPCADGQTCAPIAGAGVCLKDCQAQTDCRAGYQCFGGVCTLACQADGDCGRGFVCTSGQCMPAPGAKLGEPCSMDADCSSQLCFQNKCARSCTHDGSCEPIQTCLPNLIPPDNKMVVDSCAQRRGAAAPGAACMVDSDCDRGICLIGLCAELCTAAGDCHGSSMTCSAMPMPLDMAMTASDLPTLKVCLPQSGTISWEPLNPWLPIPSHARSMEIYTFLPSFDFNVVAGVSELDNPSGTVEYSSSGDLFTQPVRYAPAETSSVIQVPDSAAVQLTPGAWKFAYGTSSSLTPATARVYLKLSPSPITTGRIPLNFYITDLSGACASFTAANAASVLAADIGEIRNIFDQAGLTISDVTFHDVTGPNTIRVSTSATIAMPQDLDDILRTATAGHGTTAGLDVVIVRQIQDPSGQNSGVLGIAGGIPGSPEVGTAHSGAVVSVQNLCATTSAFGPVVAHETGHTLGLYHNIESDTVHHDPLTDTMSDGTNNLMYWAENMGRHLTPQQGNVVRGDLKVTP